MERSLYEEHAALERDHWWFVARRAIIDGVLARHVGAGHDRRVLDVGCGTGGMLPLLARYGRVTGLESEAVAVAHCHEAYAGFAVMQGDVPDAVPDEEPFDLVTAFDVIEHLDDDLAALTALRDACRPGATVVVTVPALMWLWSDHDVRNGHRRRYDRSGLLDVIRSAGLRPVHASYFNTVLLPLVAGSRRVRPRRTAARSDFTMPSPPVNRLLTGLMACERAPVARWGLPIGVSLIAVAARPH